MKINGKIEILKQGNHWLGVLTDLAGKVLPWEIEHESETTLTLTTRGIVIVVNKDNYSLMHTEGTVRFTKTKTVKDIVKEVKRERKNNKLS